MESKQTVTSNFNALNEQRRKKMNKKKQVVLTALLVVVSSIVTSEVISSLKDRREEKALRIKEIENDFENAEEYLKKNDFVNALRCLSSTEYLIKGINYDDSNRLAELRALALPKFLEHCLSKAEENASNDCFQAIDFLDKAGPVAQELDEDISGRVENIKLILFEQLEIHLLKAEERAEGSSSLYWNSYYGSSIKLSEYLETNISERISKIEEITVRSLKIGEIEKSLEKVKAKIVLSPFMSPSEFQNDPGLKDALKVAREIEYDISDKVENILNLFKEQYRQKRIAVILNDLVEIDKLAEAGSISLLSCLDDVTKKAAKIDFDISTRVSEIRMKGLPKIVYLYLGSGKYWAGKYNRTMARACINSAQRIAEEIHMDISEQVEEILSMLEAKVILF